MRRKFNGCSGQSIIEFALLLPLMILLIVNVVNFGGLLYAYITVASAARTGAEYMTMGPASADGPTLVATSVVTSVVNTEMSSLPYYSSATITVCSNNGGKAQSPENCTPPINPATGAMYADPQPTTSVVGTVQVQYRYCPFIPSWNFPGLDIYTTLPTCTISGGKVTGGGTQINRVAAMRILQ